LNSGSRAGHSAACGFAHRLPLESRTVELWMTRKTLVRQYDVWRGCPTRIAQNREKAPNRVAGVGTELCGSSRRLEELQSRRQNNRPARSVFHPAMLFFALPRCCAAAGTYAGLLFIMPSQHSVGYCRAVSSVSKTAGRRPYRWIALVESCRSLPSRSRRDAALPSYKGLKIASRTAVQLGLNSNQCRWREHKAAGVRETDWR
jgi:hypothetical protein